MSSRTLAPRVVIALAVVACGGGDLTLPNEGQPAEILVVDGDLQDGTVGEPLGESLVVVVRDPFERPVEGVTVVWEGQNGGTVDPATSVTGPDGRTSARRVLGLEPITYTTTATVAEISRPATFRSTALTARLLLTSQLPAIAVSGEPLSPQPELQLQDADGSPIAREGVDVTVTLAAGDGSLAGDTTVTSNAEGRVAFTDVAIRGSPGTKRLIFSAEGFAPFTTAPIALDVGAPASIGGVTGDDQRATVGEAVAIDPAVMVRDADGNPLSGIPVTFTVTRGGGTVSDETPVTGEDGIATIGEWRLGRAAGENTLSAEVAGLDLEGSPVVFSATGEPGPISASQSTVTADPATISASNGASASTITVTVSDGFGNPLSGVSVTLAVDGSGNDLTQPGGPTNERGVATGRLSAATTGARTVSATADGVALEQTAAVTVGAGAPSAATSTASVPNGQAGQSTIMEIQLKDALGNPAPGQAGAIAVSISGANTIGSLDANDEGGGRYTVRYTPVVAGTDQVTIQVSGGPIAGSPFTSQVVPGPVSPGASTAELTVTFFGVGALVTARDAQGNPVGHGGDTVVMSVNDGAPTTATDLGNGTYQVAIFVLGPQIVRIDMNGQPIQGSPFQVGP